MMRFLDHVQHRPPLERLQQPNFKFTVGDPQRPDVDILTSVAGDPEFDACFARSQALRLDGQLLHVMSVQDLMAVKESSAVLMERDATDGLLRAQDRIAAERTGEKERRDIMLLQLLLMAGG